MPCHFCAAPTPLMGNLVNLNQMETILNHMGELIFIVIRVLHVTITLITLVVFIVRC